MASQLERAVQVMDQLRSPGGCPWDAEQTHRSLAPYLLEETYEVLEAIDTDDSALLREELGDLLLQVLFHARLAEESGAEAFSIEDVAGDLVDKLVRRHPHVFEPGTPSTDAATLNETWERQKVAEKGRTSATDGVPIAQPALALAAKLVARARRAGVADTIESAVDTSIDATSEATTEPAVRSLDEEFGRRLFELVESAVAAGVDPEAALRRTAMSYRAAIRNAEPGNAGGGQ